MPTDYEEVAPAYDTRYAQNAYPGTAESLRAFTAGAASSVLEIGCGTGHWLRFLRAEGCPATGIDPSRAMLAKARAQLGADRLCLARAEELPFPDASFERIVMINALHHVGDLPRALAEARRVLREGGAFMTIGLDPSSTVRWCIYEYFAGAYERDLERYPTCDRLRRWLGEAGFRDCETTLAEPIALRFEARTALREGRLAKHTTSQLSELSDEPYARGIAAIEAAASAAEARGETLELYAELSLFATRAWV